MATVNNRYLKNTVLHPNFAKRCRNSDTGLIGILLSTKYGKYLRKDWELILESHPEYLEYTSMLIERLFTINIFNLTLRDFRTMILKLKLDEEEIQNMLFLRRRLRNRIPSPCMCRNRNRAILHSRRLKIRRDVLMLEKELLLQEINFYKAHLGLACSSD